MNAALLYLTIRRIVNSLKRLPKNPRLLIPVIFFALVATLQVVPVVMVHHFNSTLHPHHFRHRPSFAGSPVFDAGMLVASIKGMLIFSLVTTIISALGDGGVFFDPSDVDFLFPTPLSRRAVLFFRMLPAYLLLAVASVYFPIIMSSWLTISAPDLNLAQLWPGVLGSFLFLVAGANLAQTAVIFRWTKEGGSTPAQRKRATTMSMLLLAMVVGGGCVLLNQAGGAHGGFDLQTALGFLNSKAMSAVIAPITWAAELYRVAFGGWNGAATGHILGLVALTGLSFVVLFLRESDFYEGATEVSARRSKMVAAVRRGDSSALLSQMAEDGLVKAAPGKTLRTFGGGPWAIVWEQAITLTRFPLRNWLPLLFLAAVPAFVGHSMSRMRSDVGVVTWMAMFCLQMSSIFLMAVRTMLRRADITKALPIGPIPLLVAQQASPILQLTVLGWLSLTGMVLTGSGHGPFLVTAYLVLPTMTTLMLFVQTCFVVLYPQQTDAAQNVVANFLGLFVTMLAIVPGFAAGIILFFFQAPPLVLGLATGTVNLAVAAAALLFAAFLWQRFDPTS